MRAIRIACDARPLGRVKTGIARYVQGILEALLEFEEVREIALWSPREIAPGDVLAGDPRVRPSVQGGWKGNLWMQLVVPFLLARTSPDLFHATLFLPPFLGPGRFVVNIYDLTPYRYPETMERGNRYLLRALLPLAVSRAHRVVVPSEFTKEEVIGRWPAAAHKVVVVPGGPSLGNRGDPSPPEGEDDELLRRYGVRRPFLLSVGTLEPRKNLVRLVEAFAVLQQQGFRDLQLVLAGVPGWGSRPLRRAWERCPVRSAVKAIGFVPDAVLEALYRQAELFLFPSLYEGFGFPPLEAMAAGTCVVASPRGSLPECLGEAAAWVDPLDVGMIAERSAQLLRDPDLRMDFVQRGYRRVARYSWRESAAGTLEVYRDIL